MSRVIIIGQAPARSNADTRVPLAPGTQTGDALVHLLGLDAEAYQLYVTRCNLLHHYPGRWQRDDRFPVVPARVAAQAMFQLFQPEDRIVFLGRLVAEAFLPASAVKLYCRHEWYRVNYKWYAIAQHPSGRNRWFKNRKNKQEAGSFWQGVGCLARQLATGE